jgi:hypothetical protein
MADSKQLPTGMAVAPGSTLLAANNVWERLFCWPDMLIMPLGWVVEMQGLHRETPVLCSLLQGTTPTTAIPQGAALEWCFL